MACLFADDHCPVIQIPDALALRFTFPLNFEVQGVTRQVSGTQCRGNVVQVDHVDPLDAGDFVEVEVVRDNLPAKALGGPHQFLIDRLALAVS